MLMFPLSLFHDIVYIPGMWIKVAVTSGTAHPPPGDYNELWLTLPNVALTDSPCGMVTVRALGGMGVPGFEKGRGVSRKQWALLSLQYILVQEEAAPLLAGLNIES